MVSEKEVSAFSVHSGHVSFKRRQRKRCRKNINNIQSNQGSEKDKLRNTSAKKKKKKNKLKSTKRVGNDLIKEQVKILVDKQKPEEAESDVLIFRNSKDSSEKDLLNKKTAKKKKSQLSKLPQDSADDTSELKLNGVNEKLLVDHKSKKKLKQNDSSAENNQDKKNIKKTKKVKEKNVWETEVLGEDNSEADVSQILKKIDKHFVKKKTAEDKLASLSEKSKKDKRQQKFLNLVEEARHEAFQRRSSESVGKETLEKILAPYSLEDFFKKKWEKEPLHIRSNSKRKFSAYISTQLIDAILRDNIIQYGKHIDLTLYNNGQRETHNLEGRAHAHVVWDYYSNGCSVRLLNPQIFIHRIQSLNATLQEYFGCMVGANAYLTPPKSQGFAPHFDDIEAFILQVEGKKFWRLYKPLNKKGFLPRNSSRNLSQEEIGEPYLEVTLEPGDVLYFPRGWIHQGRTEDEHSLHLTLSTYQHTAWVDLLEKLLPATLKRAAECDIEFRRGLPIGYLQSAGVAYKNSSKRIQMVQRVKQLLSKLTDHLELDEAIDLMGKSFIHDAIPPVLTTEEAASTIYGNGWRMNANGKLSNVIYFSFETKVRWIRAFCCRMVMELVNLEDGTLEVQNRLYYSMDNACEYHKEDPQYLILPLPFVEAVQTLFSNYPNFTKIVDLPCETEEEKMTIVGDLWDRGLLATDQPLEVIDEPDEDTVEKNLSPEEKLVLEEIEEEAVDSDENENLLELDVDNEGNDESDDMMDEELKNDSDMEDEEDTDSIASEMNDSAIAAEDEQMVQLQ